MILARLSSWCFRHRWATLVVWVLVLVGANAVAGAAGPDFNNSFELPGTDSHEAFVILDESDPDRAGDTAEIVVETEAGVTDPGVESALTELFGEVGAVDGVVGVQGPYDGPQQISMSGTIAFARVQFGERVGQVDLESLEEVQALVDGADEQLEGTRVVLGGFVVQATEEPEAGVAELVGLAAAVLILLLAFRSVLAMGLPLAVAVFGIGIGLAILTLLTYVVSTPQFAPQMASMIGIGVGIDYALFIVTRYREGLAEGLEPVASTAKAMRTAGRAVMFAGFTVVISMLGLLLMGFDFIHGVAVGAAIVVLMTMLGSVTLLPALLGFSGHNIDKWSIRPIRGDALSGENSLAYRWSRVMQRHSVVAALVSLAVLLTLAAPVLSMRMGVSDAGNNPESYGTRQAYDLLADGFGPGFNGPFLLAARIDGEDDLAALTELSQQLDDLDGVVAASPPQPNEDLTSALIYVTPAYAPQDEEIDGLLGSIRDDVIPAVAGDADVEVHVGGIVAVMSDFTDQVAERLPLFFAVVIGLSFLLLMVVFRSLLVPIKAAVMNLLSIGAAYGVIVAIFQWGWGAELIGIGRPGPIESWVPIMLFAILFGLSMDYEVFLLSRILEDYHRTGDNAQAVANGLAKTARVITAAAAIMITVFLSFALTADVRQIKLFAIGLAVAILVDATIVRLVLVPSTMELLGKANWWLPGWLDRLLPDVHIEAEVDAFADEPVGDADREPVGVG